MAIFPSFAKKGWIGAENCPADLIPWTFLRRKSFVELNFFVAGSQGTLVPLSYLRKNRENRVGAARVMSTLARFNEHFYSFWGRL